MACPIVRGRAGGMPAAIVLALALASAAIPAHAAGSRGTVIAAAGSRAASVRRAAVQGRALARTFAAAARVAAADSLESGDSLATDEGMSAGSPRPIEIRDARPALWQIAARDSVSLRYEVGATTEISNELFYEEIYTDTTFLGRRLHGTPQTRTAGVAAFEWSGLSRAGTLTYSLRPEVTLGDQLTRAVTSLSLRLRPDERWRFSLEPRAEYSRDIGFGVERRQVLVGSTAHVRRRLENEADALDLRMSGEALATPRSNDPYLLAHRVGGASLGWEHTSYLGWDWNARAGSQLRTFPDSTARDHAEHRLEGAFRRDFDGGQSLAMGAEVARRNTLRPQAGTRDRFVEVQANLSAGWRLGDGHTLRATFDHEGIWYDAPDSSVDFDYAVDRVQLSVRRELADGFTLSLGPRGEMLTAAWNPEERYREIAGVLELELVSGSRWWLLQPLGGWRAYGSSSDGSGGISTALHSSFAFVEFQAYGDQALPARLRARVLLNGRLERHRDDSQNSRSLYFSLDLRRLF